MPYPALNFLLDKFLVPDILASRVYVAQMAYILATAYHETGGRLEPRREIRQRIAVTARQRRIKRLQDRYWHSGYYGRGYVQITWKYNYLKFGLDRCPDKALLPEVAFDILYRGMQEGMFTGRKLNDYIFPGHTDFLRARKIVNGMDRAGLVADYALKFQDILKKSMT